MRNTGKKLSVETRSKISENLKGKFIGGKHPMYGKHLSAETRRKMSENRKGRFMGGSCWDRECVWAARICHSSIVIGQ